MFFPALLRELQKSEANEGEAAAATASKQQMQCKGAGENHSEEKSLLLSVEFVQT